MQGFYYMNSVKPPTDYRHLLKRLPYTEKSKLAIFDMDETLIHCIPDIKILQSDTGSSGNRPVDVQLEFRSRADGIEFLPVNIRSFVKEAVRKIKEDYQCIIFTASKQEYADTILNYLDPGYELFEARCYRDSCYTTADGVYVKDLRIFEQQWDLKDVVLIDNAVHSFGFQINNGIPMLPFYDDKSDKDMLYVAQYMKKLAKKYDVRPTIRDTFYGNRLRDPMV
jgi:CTD small phosphatase-like protein 2